MNTPIEDFAQAPQRDAGYYTHNNEVADQVFKFLKEESQLRQFFVPKPMNNVLSKTYIVEYEEGLAYQVVGNAEVPRAEDVSTQFTTSYIETIALIVMDVTVCICATGFLEYPNTIPVSIYFTILYSWGCTVP